MSIIQIVSMCGKADSVGEAGTLETADGQVSLRYSPVGSPRQYGVVRWTCRWRVLERAVSGTLLGHSLQTGEVEDSNTFRDQIRFGNSA